MAAPHCDQSTSPAPWWDREADKSLVVGTYKHGYEGYARMRSDPSLVFLALCGPPQPSASSSTPSGVNTNSEEKDMKLSDEDDTSEMTSQGGLGGTTSDASQEEGTGEDKTPQWPSMVDLNQRLRRVINSYQRNFKKEELKLAQKAKHLGGGVGGVMGGGVGGGPGGVGVGGGLAEGAGPELASLMAAHGWDWHQLAMYLWKVERREKFEQIVRERERQRLEVNQKKWSRREDQDFYRTISTYGVEYDRQKKKYDWTKFRAISKLDKKFDETMTEYYRAFSAMCKRACGIKPTPEEEASDMVVEPFTEDRARRVLERVALLSKIREETLVHPQLEERLTLCQPSADVPEWWIPGKHDKDLLIGAAKHGLGRTDFYILNDPELSFREIAQKNVLGLKGEVILEKGEEAVISEKTEIVVKLEKGEGTLKIEKVGLKTEEPSETKLFQTKAETIEEKPEAADEVQVAPSVETSDKVEGEEKIEELEDHKEAKEEIKKEEPLKETDEELAKVTEEKKEDKTKEENEEETETKEEVTIAKEENPEEKKEEEEKTVEIESMKETTAPVTSVSSVEKGTEIEGSLGGVTSVLVPQEEKPLAIQEPKTIGKKEEAVEGLERFKAMFPELEVMQKLPEIDVVEKLQPPIPRTSLDSTVAQLIAHSYQNPIKWPKEHALQVRLQHIVHAVEHKEWPVGRNFSAYTSTGVGSGGVLSGIGGVASSGIGGSYMEDEDGGGGGGGNGVVSVGQTIIREAPPPSEVITITTDPRPTPLSSLHHQSKRKRHIAIDVETERAKLHELLKNTNLQLQHAMKPSPSTPWDHTDESLSEDSRRSTPLGLQPPPAHQGSLQSSRASSSMGGMSSHGIPFDLSLHHSGSSGKSTPPTILPGTTLTPIDLSSGSNKVTANNSSGMDEVQDFSMKPKHLSQPPAAHQHQSTLHQSPAHQSQLHQSSQQSKSKLDDMLNKLMQRKNCPTEEPLVGKEKKRRKLDEIVLGLSAAKEQASGGGGSLMGGLSLEKKSVVPSSVTVTLSSGGGSSKPPIRPSTAVTAPSPSQAVHDQQQAAAAAAAASFLLKQQQSLLQQQTLKLAQQQSHQQQAAAAVAAAQAAAAAAAQQQPSAAHSHRKTYEAMIADISKVAADFSTKTGASFSQEAKVNKWLAEQSGMVGAGMGGMDAAADLLGARRRRPRVDPTLLDWKKLTGEENVSVINRVTGKKLTGSKAPQLKRLAGWLLENPMFDVDPKWAELVKERGNLPQDLAKRVPPSGDRGKKSGSGGPSLMPPTSSQPSSVFPGLNPSLLSGLSLGGFDPKTNPLLLPFGGMGGMAAAAAAGLGNPAVSLFANLASLGLPGLDSGAMDSPGTSKGISSQSVGGGNSGPPPTKQARKPPDTPTSTPQPPPPTASKGGAAASSLANSLPFFFPNPSLLYSPLGLGALNPFSLQTGAYETLGLLNGGVGRHSAKSSTPSPTTQTSRSAAPSPRPSPVDSSRPPSRGGMVGGGSIGSSRGGGSGGVLQQQHQQQLRPRDLDSLRNLMAAVPPFKPSPTREREMKEALETLTKNSAELFARIPRPPHPQQTPQSTPLPAAQQQPLSLLPPQVQPLQQHQQPPLPLSLSMETKMEEKGPEKRTRDSGPLIGEVPPSKKPKPEAATSEKASETEATKLPVDSVIVQEMDKGTGTSPRPQEQKASSPLPLTPAPLEEIEEEKEMMKEEQHSLPIVVPIVGSPQPVNTGSSNNNGGTVGGASPTISPSREEELPPQQTIPPPPQTVEDPPPPTLLIEEEPPRAAVLMAATEESNKEEDGGGGGSTCGGPKKKRSRAKRSPVTIVTDVVERKNLRSSAGRAAAAAAARQRAASLDQQQQQLQQHQQTSNQ